MARGEPASGQGVDPEARLRDSARSLAVRFVNAQGCRTMTGWLEGLRVSLALEVFAE